MTILDRLTSRCSRSLSVMIGHGQSGVERGRKARRGSRQGCGGALVTPFPSLPLSPSSR